MKQEGFGHGLVCCSSKSGAAAAADVGNFVLQFKTAAALDFALKPLFV